MSLKKKITRKNLEAFLSEHKTDERVLDVGSGGSRYDIFFPNRLTVDIDKNRKPEIIADIHDLPFKDGEYNFILCTEVLEHVSDPQKAISELGRVLSKGGKLVLTTRFVYPIHDAPHDYWRFTRYGLEKVFSEWNIQEIRAETHTFSALGALLQRIVFQTKLRMNKPIKFVLLMLAWILDHSNKLVITEYGDIKKTSRSEDILTTGYYVVAIKK